MRLYVTNLCPLAQVLGISGMVHDPSQFVQLDDTLLQRVKKGGCRERAGFGAVAQRERRDGAVAQRLGEWGAVAGMKGAGCVLKRHAVALGWAGECVGCKSMRAPELSLGLCPGFHFPAF